MIEDSTQAPGRAGFCALLGLPNVGKSTLMNQMLGRRLVAVSNKPQTTRNRIVGVKNLAVEDGEPAQIVFVDTPGIQLGKGALRHYMREQVLSAAGDCDVAVLVVDAADPAQKTPDRLATTELHGLEKALGEGKAQVILAINKVDKLRTKEELLPMIEAFAAGQRYAAIVPIAAAHGIGVEELAVEVARRLPQGPKLFPEEMFTDRAERFIAAELIREQLFRQLGDEVPYATACMVEKWEERESKGDVVIHAVIFVERDSQKGIVVGRGGQRIRSVGEKAREAISELLGCPAHVKLFVKVSPNWSQGDKSIRDLGYE